MPSADQYAALLINLLPIALMLAVFYFFIIRPQQKRDKNEKSMRSSLEVGDKVVTIGGIIGRVTKVWEKEVAIQTSSDNTKIQFQKQAIAAKLVEEIAE